MLRITIFCIITVISHQPWAKEISFKTTDNATIYANYQAQAHGAHAILLAHGAIFNKESWGKFEKKLLEENFTVLAIDFRGYNNSTLGDTPQALYKDILAGVKFLRDQSNITHVTVLGASMGGSAAAKASVYSAPEMIDQLILLSPASIYNPQALKGRLLFIASEDEYLSQFIEAAFKEAPKKKTLKLIKGKAHAQHIFKTPQAEMLTDTIIDFLKKI